MEIDRYKLKIRGFTIELEGPLDRESLTNVLIEVSIEDVGTPSREDGTFDKVYKGKFFGGSQVQQSGKKPIKGKDKRGLSKRLRGAIYFKSQDEGLDDDEEYKGFMNWILRSLNTLWELYLKDKDDENRDKYSN